MSDTPSSRTPETMDAEAMRKVAEHRAFFCNKCGYYGQTAEHPGCNYFAAESIAVVMLRSLLSRLEARERELAEARRERDEWVEREAKVCPEDFSFEEVIESLRSQNAEMMRVVDQSVQLLYAIDGEFSHYSPAVQMHAELLRTAHTNLDAARSSRPTETPEPKND